MPTLLLPLDVGDLDPRYVNISGDTMTGALVVTPAADSTSILNVTNQAGTSLLNIDTSNRRVGIFTTAPTGTFEIKEPSLMNLVKFGGTATAQNTWGGWVVSHAFDGEVADSGGNWSNTFCSSSIPVWIKWDFGSGKSYVVTQYRIYYKYYDSWGTSPNNWTFAGSNNDTDWTTLDTRTSQQWSSTGWKEYTIVNSTAYRYYRLNVTSAASGYCYVSELELMGVPPATEKVVSIVNGYLSLNKNRSGGDFEVWESSQAASPIFRVSRGGSTAYGGGVGAYGFAFYAKDSWYSGYPSFRCGMGDNSLAFQAYNKDVGNRPTLQFGQGGSTGFAFDGFNYRMWKDDDTRYGMAWTTQYGAVATKRLGITGNAQIATVSVENARLVIGQASALASKIGIVGTQNEVTGIIKAYSGQTSDMLQFQSSGGTVLSYIDSLGGLSMSRSTNSTTAYNFKNSSGTSILNIDTTNGYVGIKNTSPSYTLDVGGYFNVVQGSSYMRFYEYDGALNSAFYLKIDDGDYGAGAFLSMNAEEGVTFTGSTIAISFSSYFDIGGNAPKNFSGICDVTFTNVGNVGIGTASPSGRLHINGTADDQQLIVEAHSTQTNNIFEIHDSSSNVLISFDGVGGAVFNEYGSSTGDFRVESDTEANMLFVDANADTDGAVYLGGSTNGVKVIKGGATSIKSATAGALTIGAGTAGIDYSVTFDGETNDGVLVWMEDEDYFQFSDDIMLPGGENIVLGTATGTQIGTATSQLLGFWGATPVDRPATVADATTQDLTGADTVDRTKVEADLSSLKTAVNALIDRLQEVGLIA